MGVNTRRVHAIFSILDPHDNAIRKLEMGTATYPTEITEKCFWGCAFTPTAEEKAQSLYADGTIRLRAEVRVFRG